MTWKTLKVIKDLVEFVLEIIDHEKTEVKPISNITPEDKHLVVITDKTRY